jgi:hypothetical protein
VASEPAAGNILYNQVTITWSTNEPADSQVDYGPTVAYGQSTPYTVAPGTQQSHQLTGLVANTTYHYRIRSRDIAGNESVSTDKTFTTAPAPVATANLTAISPVSTRANREIELIATGTNFTGSNVILLDGVIMPTTFISSTELRATISAANLATPGLKYIEVG